MGLRPHSRVGGYFPLKFDGLSRYGPKESTKMTGWWFGTWLDYFPFHIWDVILPIDEFIFFKMFFNHQPDDSLLATDGPAKSYKPNGWFVHPIDGVNHLSGSISSRPKPVLPNPGIIVYFREIIPTWPNNSG